MKMRFNIRRYFQVLGVSLAVVIAAAAVCMGIDFNGMNGEEQVDNTSTVLAADGKINVLLMAVDVDGLRTDAMMLGSFDTETKEVHIMSIPRDTRMYIGNRYQKINAAHAYATNGVIGGPTAACEAVTRITGIPINYYIDFSFDAVAHVVNELGPIEFEIPDLYGDGVGMVYDDPVQSLHINLPPGKYGEGPDCDYPGLDGSQAVWLMRYRHGNADASGNFKGYTNGDKDRVEMQQKFISAVVDQKLNTSLILKIPSIFKTISSEIKTNFTVSDVIKYSKYLSGFSSENIHSHELPGRFDTALMDGYTADVWEVDIEATRELVQTVFGYPADNITIDNPNGTSGGGSSTYKGSRKDGNAGSSSGKTESAGYSGGSEPSKSSGSSGSANSSGSSGSINSSGGSGSSNSSGKSEGSGSNTSNEEDRGGSSESLSGSGSGYDEDDDAGYDDDGADYIDEDDE